MPSDHSIAYTESLPALPLSAWQDTCDTLHLWTQMAGKVRLALSPRVNHWWECPLYLTARGLTTSAIRYGPGAFQIDFDFLDHALVIATSAGPLARVPLRAVSVAQFYREFMAALRSAGLDIHIWPVPVEIPNAIRFDHDETHASYDPEYARRFWRILLWSHNVLQEFRARFLGKCSPVHFFWGSFDLAVTRFSGRPAPARPGADSITREAYSHEVSSVGFWPGNGGLDQPAFYSYMAPEPPNFPAAKVRPPAATYNSALHNFLLLYDDVRQAPSPRQAVLDFAQSTYEAGATLAAWDRPALERQP
jgi:Family of unknown function (DUF5996)